MRRLPTTREGFSVIVPVHVASRLGFMSRETANQLRNALEEVALDAAEGHWPGAPYTSPDHALPYLEADGMRLCYRVDGMNRTVLAVRIESVGD